MARQGYSDLRLLDGPLVFSGHGGFQPPCCPWPAPKALPSCPGGGRCRGRWGRGSGLSMVCLGRSLPLWPQPPSSVRPGTCPLKFLRHLPPPGPQGLQSACFQGCQCGGGCPPPARWGWASWKLASSSCFAPGQGLLRESAWFMACRPACLSLLEQHLGPRAHFYLPPASWGSRLYQSARAA